MFELKINNNNNLIYFIRLQLLFFLYISIYFKEKVFKELSSPSCKNLNSSLSNFSFDSILHPQVHAWVGSCVKLREQPTYAIKHQGHAEFFFQGSGSMRHNNDQHFFSNTHINNSLLKTLFTKVLLKKILIKLSRTSERP